MRLLKLLTALATLGTIHAQNDISWLAVEIDNSRLVSTPELGTADVQEKDYAWGDLDQDGWTDLVVARKEPFTTAGRFPNVLFMNEQGTLVDRTGLYAAASDVPGDQGFLTPTNDRDIAVADVTGDGWLDVITAPTISPGLPKHISHPRIYVNLGLDGNGDWLGLLYEEARTPDWGTYPTFCGVGVGDVTGDGSPDLYFAHYDSGSQQDLNDRLLVNDGNGFFSDETAARMSSNMTSSGFGTSAVIVDLNGDGASDVADGESGVVNLIYNDPANVGYFNILHNPYFGAPYHVNTGDLNQDGKPDLVISDDGADRYLLNQGNDALGRVSWSSPHVYNTDDGFASNNLVVDLDGDGWGEAIYCDVDVDIPGCDRRMHLFHNRGGTVGGFVSLFEESGAGSVGATGLTATALRGMHDVAVFDLDNDGDLDLVLGRCSGTSVYLSQLAPDELGTRYCSPAVANSSGQPGRIAAVGSDQVSDNDLSLVSTDLPVNQFAYLLASLTQGFVSNPGGSQGNLCLGGQIGRFVQQIQNTGPNGTTTVPVDLTQLPPPLGSIDAGETWNFQTWFRDKNPSNTSNFTDGISVLFL